MSEIASARINTFGPSPKADFVPPDDPILEIPLSEFQNILKDLVLIYNQMAETVRDAGILRGTRAGQDSQKTTQEPSKPRDRQ